jgi:hypothetical protein
MTWAEEQKRAYECKRQDSDCGIEFMLHKEKETVFTLCELTLRLQVQVSPVIKDVTCVTNIVRMPLNTEL